MSNFVSRLGDAFKKSKPKLSSDAVMALVVGLIIVVNVIVYALTEAFGLFLYSEQTVDFGLSGSTDELFSEAIEDGECVTVMFCQSEDDVHSSSTGRFVLETAKRFAERYPGFIELEYVNIITRRNSKNELVDLSKYQTYDEASDTTSKIYKTSVIFASGDNFKVLTDPSDEGYANFFTLDSTSTAVSYNGEEMMASMINWVLTRNDEHKTAYFTTFHGEIADLGIGNMLASAGYNIDTVDLRKREVPEDAGIVVISNPKKDFERAMEGSHVRTEIERLRTYMQNGGKIYVAIDPYVEKLSVLENFLAEFGISISETRRDDGKLLRNIVRDSRNSITADNFTLVTGFADSDTAGKISATVGKYSDSGVLIRECAALELSGTAEAIIVSSSASSTYAGSEETDRSGSYCVGAVGSYVNDDGAEGRIFVTSSAYLTATDALVSDGYSNRPFVYALLEHVFESQRPPYGCNTVNYDTDTLEDLTMGSARLYTLAIAAIPAIIAITGAVVIVRRKNR